MDTNEALQLAGSPSAEITGSDWYYTKRHRVELNQGKVDKIDLHLRASLDTLDWIRLNFTSGGLLFMNITLAFIMFGVALEIKFESFKNLAKNPKPVLVGAISQFIALPALTFLLVLLIKPSPSVAMGMILVAACPGGNISNFVSSLAKGNVALSVSLTAVATLSAIFLTPFNFAFWGSLYSEASDLVIPFNIDAWEMIKTVFILLGIPIIAGLWFARKFPVTTEKVKKPMKWLSILFFFGFVVAALASNFSYFLKFIHLILLIVLAHNALALLTGFSIASLFKLPRADRRTITIETGIQNSGLGLVLIFNPNLFNGLGGMAFIAAWWGIWHILSGMSLATLWARKPLND
ncbi:MAG: bile acid:sodium symporter family protein [Bacteroidales bacterium]|nr:bile acid:sodium symporter family protein [Bacteroidales bacterium]MBN2748183.1 bile acid:sodium symporter family protein [Bacteroidales bacterium]